MVVERISRFIADPDSEDFEALALAAFAYQHAGVAPYRRLCEARGATPATVTRWQDIPPVPALAFKSLVLAAAPARETFRSSGTRSGTRSVHHHPFPDLYRSAVDASFPHFCLPRGDRPPMLALAPSRSQAPDASLAFMVDHVMARWGGPGSAYAFGPRGVDVPLARSWLAARQRDRQAPLVLATTLALVQLLDALERRQLRFRLPPGSAVFDTGGEKGRRLGVSREELLARLPDRLDLAPEQVVREYGMTELSSQCYTATLRGGDAETFVAPPWMRVRILDPETLSEAASGTPGLIAILDLANVGSALHLLTEDLGRAVAGGFHLEGRAADAELRGCSLTVEELAGGFHRDH